MAVQERDGERERKKILKQKEMHIHTYNKMQIISQCCYHEQSTQRDRTTNDNNNNKNNISNHTEMCQQFLFAS